MDICLNLSKDLDIIKEYIDKFSSLEFRKITNKKISEKTGISLRTVSTILNRFKKIDILNQDREGFYKKTNKGAYQNKKSPY